VQARRDRPADQGCHDEQPYLAQRGAADDQRRPEAARVLLPMIMEAVPMGHGAPGPKWPPRAPARRLPRARRTMGQARTPPDIEIMEVAAVGTGVL